MTTASHDDHEFDPQPCPTCGIIFPNWAAIQSHHVQSHDESLPSKNEDQA